MNSQLQSPMPLTIARLEPLSPVQGSDWHKEIVERLQDLAQIGAANNVEMLDKRGQTTTWSPLE